jgi:protein phosphatase
MALRIRSVARSDVGLVREANEDSGYAGPRLLAVADGMGGHAAGEVASAVVVEELAALDGPETQGSETALRDDPAGTLVGAIVAANGRIRELVRADPGRSGMGTTVTALLWDGAVGRIAHIGDSRAYLWRGGRLTRLTHDHTYVQALIDDGRITATEAETHPARSLLLRALGGDEPDPDVQELTLRADDRLLLCSDGLTGVVRDPTLAQIFSEGQGLDETADRLVDLALRGGAPDNVTCVVAEVLEVPDPPVEDADRDRTDDTTEAHLVGAAAGGAAHPDAPVVDDDDPDEPAADPAELERYRPRERRRGAWLWPGLALVAVLVLGALAVTTALRWYETQYYVGVEGDLVVIRQGVPGLPGSSVVEALDGLPLAAVPDVFAEELAEGIRAEDLADAEAIGERVRVAACAPPSAATFPGLVCPDAPATDAEGAA